MKEVKIIVGNKSDKQGFTDWDDFYKQVKNSTTVDLNETPEQQKKRIAKLEADHEAWFKYYFPSFYSSEPAPFHVAATRRVMNNPEWYEVRAWSRELAKSARSMMEDLKLLLTKKKKYKILTSATYDAAAALMRPYKIILEVNQRIINDYGIQEKPGSWQDGDITSRAGFSIRALGAGQSPRGTRKDEVRPDIIEFDDFDTDEECANIDIIEKKWKWCNDALIGTRSISKPTLIRWNGNLIAEDCCVQRAIEFADKVDIVNIRDADGNSTWPTKNTEENIDRVLSKIPYSTQQKEYYNNPHTEGKDFKEMKWSKCPKLSEFDFVVAYSDPATSNKDKPSTKSKANNSTKSVALVGCKDEIFYIITCFVDHVKNSTFIDWMYSVDRYAKAAPACYNYIENNTLQQPFYEQVLLPLIYQRGLQLGYTLPVISDDRKKGEKYHRISATLEPLNTNGQLVLNIDEKENPHMKRMEAQFKSVSIKSKTMDGPDAVQGAVQIIKEKNAVTAAGGFKAIKRKPNNKRY